MSCYCMADFKYSTFQDKKNNQYFESAKQWNGPKTLTLKRGKNGFGFSLRYFEVETPVFDSPSSKGFNRNSFWLDQGLGENDADDNLLSAAKSSNLDIFFIKDVEKGSWAEMLELQQVSVNGDLVGGKSYKDVVELIKNCDGELKIGVIPHGQDILYTIYQEFDSKEYSFDCQQLRKMSQPSVNKWAASIQPRKSASMETRHNSFMDERKYDPCVSFVAGTPILNQESRSSRSSSIGSSGMHTPLRKADSLPLTQSSNSIELGNQSPTLDQNLGFSVGQPQNNEIKDDDLGSGVPPQTLNKALKREVYKKSYGLRLAPKMISGVSKPGAVSNIKELFAPGRNSVNLGRRYSATSVLREDFQHDDNIGFYLDSEEYKSMRQNDSKSQLSDSLEKEALTIRLTTKNYQATLIESSDCKQSESLTLGEENTIIITPKFDENIASSQKHSTMIGIRKQSTSSVENSDEDDSDVHSENEQELNNWEDRRASYLQLKDKEISRKGNSDADGEDSDTNSNKSQGHSQKPPDDEASLVIKEGPLNRKLEKSIDKKKAHARTWKPVYAVLKGHRLFCYKAQGCDADNDIIQPIPIRSSIIEIASDYVKRRHVIRMVTSHGNEYLFQAEDTAAMMSWVHALRDANPDKESLLKSTASIKTHKKFENEPSPPHPVKFIGKEKKGTYSLKMGHFSLRSRKSRGSDAPIIINPKYSVAPKTFGIPIHSCPPAKNVKNVPLVVEHCCNVIGERGKEVVGIYRVPGNTSNIQLLKRELDEKDPKDINWDEEKWYELNNIGSLLKSFLRELPEPIIHNNVYSTLLESNHLNDQMKKMATMKTVIKSLPEYHYCTLQFLINHLRVIADHSDKNKMEPKNLAIVFGPTIVRTNEGDLASMVKDMSDQCKIIETLILNSEWMFCEGDEPPPEIESNNNAEIISANTSKWMADSLNKYAVPNVENDPVQSGNKGQKFLNKLLNKGNKMISPIMDRKKSSTTEPPRQIEPDSDSETSGFSETQSPLMPFKSDKIDGSDKLKRAEIHHFVPSEALVNTNSLVSKNMGTFLQNSKVSMRFDRNKFSPESNYLDDTDVLIKQSQSSNISKQDDEDSGITSPQRFDSDDNNSLTSESSCGFKEPYGSQSPVIGRTMQVFIPTVKRANSLGGYSADADELSPTSTPSLQKPFPVEVKDKSESEIVKNDSVFSRYEKRCEVRRGRKPCDAKRELYSILPGDGNNYEEKMRVLLDKNYDGVIRDQVELEMCKKPSRVLNSSAKLTKISDKQAKITMDDSKSKCLTDDSSDKNLLLNDSKQKNITSDENKNFFLSTNQVSRQTSDENKNSFSSTNQISRQTSDKISALNNQVSRQPTDKISALNIITNAIDMKQRSNNICNSLLSPAIVRKVSLMPMQSYNPQLVARIDEFKHKREMLDKKVESLLANASEINAVTAQVSVNSNMPNIRSQNLSSRPINIKPDTNSNKPFVNSNESSSGNIALSPNKSKKLDEYLLQVAELLNDSKNSEIHSNRLRGDNDLNDSLSHEKRSIDQLRDRTFSKCSTREYVEERNSPLLDYTYSNLNYSKLYPS
ncbi:uncharacterized protein LOC100198854 isoform X8 [Hydra vulgaris]|uniref:Uncharacterized protein LOC100198854 isoform X8 n=2 Tax=Hydra vulgaris TaxID=6087 RepID=A0ABM4CTF3_HYDVU